MSIKYMIISVIIK